MCFLSKNECVLIAVYFPSVFPLVVRGVLPVHLLSVFPVAIMVCFWWLLLNVCFVWVAIKRVLRGDYQRCVSKILAFCVSGQLAFCASSKQPSVCFYGFCASGRGVRHAIYIYENAV